MMRKTQTLDSLQRYGLASQELKVLEQALQGFRCDDTCGRRRACLDRLCLAARDGDALAVKLLTTPHHSRLMDEATLAYGKSLNAHPCRDTALQS